MFFIFMASIQSATDNNSLGTRHSHLVIDGYGEEGRIDHADPSHLPSMRGSPVCPQVGASHVGEVPFA